MKKFCADEEHVKYLGRTALRDNVLWCAHSASGIEFAVRAKRIIVNIVGDSSVNDPESLARVGLFVDDMCAAEIMVEAPEMECVILDSEEEEVHVVRVVKLSESRMSVIGIRDIVTDGDICPTVDKRFLVEFIGDSITCGYGVDDENELHPFHTYTEDATCAFSYIAARDLDVDYSMVSFSGHGVLSGYTDNGVIKEDELLPPHYKKVGSSYNMAGLPGKEFRIDDLAWDFKRQPDAIFINLGTNDASYCGEDEDRRAVYRQRYVDFLKMVRECNSHAYILCGLGMMGDELYPSMCQAVDEYKKETGDERVDTLYLEAIKPEKEGYVADYHPTIRTHTRIAGVVSEKLKEIFKSEYGENVGEKIVALTFDDGPSDITPAVLDVLKEYYVPATFFLEGQHIDDESTEVVKRAVKEGHEIENHSIYHKAMSAMPIADVLDEIKENDERISSITGVRPKFFRPPYIAVSEEMKEQIPNIMIAGYGAEDWEESVSASMRAQRILSQLRDGIIILLHDAKGNQKTVDALPYIIESAGTQGYIFVTLNDLFAEKDVTPRRGVVYREAENA